MPYNRFLFNQTYACEMAFEEFHNDHHLGNWNGVIFAILNLHVALMTPIDCHFWISERNQFNIA